LLSGTAAAQCVEPVDGMAIYQNTVFCARTFDLPNGISIGADNIELDCGGAILRGNMKGETGLRIDGRKNVRIKGCNILTYKIGIYIKNSTYTTITKTSLLKNKIGLRLLSSYENNITEINDKSTETPVSVISSKFNIFLFENKDIYGGFCSSNICNKLINMSFCDDNDFYCSESCNSDNDRDCKGIRDPPKPKEKTEAQQETKQPEPAILPETNKTNETPQANTNATPTGMAAEEIKEKSVGRISKDWLLYLIVYVIAFFALLFYTYAQNSIRI
ncbi:MAG: hypothetical protein QW666_03780, partial [Candidatus Woesearchaeota archaeon]